MPIAAQVDGRYWSGRMAAVREEFGDTLEGFANRLASGEPTSPQQIERIVRDNRMVRELFLRYPPTIPFAGDTLLGAADCFNRLNLFYTRVRGELMKAALETGRDSPLARLIRDEYQEVMDFLPKAEELYQQSLKNYKYHGLYWRLGQVQLELSKRPNLPAPIRDDLIRSGRWALRAANRIVSDPEQLFIELTIAIEVGDSTGAEELMGRLVRAAPDYVARVVFPKLYRTGMKRDSLTGRKLLDPHTRTFFSLLLPYLNASNASLYLAAMTLLDGGNAPDLVREYCQAGRAFLSPIDANFIVFRALEERESLGDLADEMAQYRALITRPSPPSPDRRFVYLSDLQRFAPASADLVEWEREIEALRAYPDHPLAVVGGWHALAQKSLAEGDALGAWRNLLQAQSKTTVSNYGNVAGRRAGTLEAALWGVGWPLGIE